MHVVPPKLQFWHAAPDLPHAVSWSPGRQVDPEQHPEGQLFESQMQAPPMQRCPFPHAGAVPHLQPPAEHALALLGSQATHAAPPVPQFPRLGVRQVAPEQHPFGQL